MKAKIYKPTKNAMQSGTKNTAQWLLEFDSGEARFVEPLMGWTGSPDTTKQLKLRFPTKEAAIAYAEKHRIAYEVLEPKARRIIPKTYAENFSFKRIRT